MHGLTTYLQQINIDFSSASAQAKALLSTFEEQRKEHGFLTVYERGVHAARTVGTSPSTPRLTCKQKHRANCATSSVEDYYRINIYYPFIDHCITELKACLCSDDQEFVNAVSSVLPHNFMQIGSHGHEEKIASKIKTLFPDFPSPYTFEQELRLCRKFCSERLCENHLCAVDFLSVLMLSLIHI